MEEQYTKKSQVIFSEPSLKGKVKFLLQNLYDQRWLIAMLLGIEVILSVLGAITPYFLKLQVDLLQYRKSYLFQTILDPQSWFALLLFVPALIELIRINFFQQLSNEFFQKFDNQLRKSSEQLIWKKLEHFDIGFFQNSKNQRLLDLAWGIKYVTTDFFNFAKNRVSGVVSIIAIIPLLGLVSWQLLVLVAVATILQAWINSARDIHERQVRILEEKRSQKLWPIEQALRRHFYALNLFGETDLLLDRYYRLVKEEEQWNRQRDRKNKRFDSANWLVRRSMEIAANLFVGFQVLQGNLSLGTFTLVLSYTMQLSNIFSEFFRSLEEWQKLDFKFDQIYFFLNLQTRIKHPTTPISMPSNPKHMRFQHVTFHYPDFFEQERAYLQFMLEKGKLLRKKNHWAVSQYDLEDLTDLLKTPDKKQDVLHNVNLTLARGKVIALLGRNGAGKTTMTQLLLHQYEPDEGSVTLDEHPLFEYSQKKLLGQFGVIQQDPIILYGFSVRENILIGTRRQVSNDELWHLLDELLIGDFLRSLPNKLETVVGEETNFSGGQEQLIAVARVFLQKRNFLIFDEGMSQMDIEKEMKVVSLLKKEATRAGVLFITHRITTARKADYIYFLDQGSIVEEGTHQQLLEKNGLYAKFWTMQVIEM